MKRLVPFVEGAGDEDAVPSLIASLIRQLPEELQASITIGKPFQVGDVTQVLAMPKGKSAKPEDAYGKYLRAAAKQRPFGGVLILLDGDKKKVEGRPFCPGDVARRLIQRARPHGAEQLFSIAVCFAMKEFESFLIPVAPQFLPGISEADLPENPEHCGKNWLQQRMRKLGGYKPVPDQARLTSLVTNWATARRMRSFQRLERVIHQFAEAFATNKHIVSPSLPPPEATGS